VTALTNLLLWQAAGQTQYRVFHQQHEVRVAKLARTGRTGTRRINDQFLAVDLPTLWQDIATHVAILSAAGTLALLLCEREAFHTTLMTVTPHETDVSALDRRIHLNVLSETV
jgi:hypothetical protein